MSIILYPFLYEQVKKKQSKFKMQGQSDVECKDKVMLKARNYRSNIRRCPLINCLYCNFRLDNLKKHLKSNRHKISNENVVNRIFEMVRSNSLPVDTLLRVQNDNIVHVTVGPRMGLPDSQLESTMTNSITLPVPVV